MPRFDWLEKAVTSNSYWCMAQGSNCSKPNEELGWKTLSDWRMGRRILQIHKIMNSKTPSYLKDKLLPSIDHSPIDLYLMFSAK